MPCRPPRCRRADVVLAGLALAALPLLGACGSSGPTATTTASTDLHITLNQTGGAGPIQSWDVTCPSTSHAVACTALLAAPDAFTAPPPNAACTMIYGGPQVLTVDGHLGTRQITYRIGRANGCEIAAFTRDIALVSPFRRT